MSTTHGTSGRYEIARSGGRVSGGSGIPGVFRRYENSSLPLGLKWSVSIAALIVTAMGVLGFYLIQQQEESYRSQVDPRLNYEQAMEIAFLLAEQCK